MTVAYVLRSAEPPHPLPPAHTSMTEPWPRLPREVVESPSLEIFKTRLDKDLCSCSGWPCFGRGLDWVIHRGPFQPQTCCDSVTLQRRLCPGDGLFCSAQGHVTGAEAELWAAPHGDVDACLTPVLPHGKASGCYLSQSLMVSPHPHQPPTGPLQRHQCPCVQHVLALLLQGGDSGGWAGAETGRSFGVFLLFSVSPLIPPPGQKGSSSAPHSHRRDLGSQKEATMPCWKHKRHPTMSGGTGGGC